MSKEIDIEFSRRIDLLIDLVNETNKLEQRDKNFLINSLLYIITYKSFNRSFTSVHKTAIKLRLNKFNEQHFDIVKPIKFKDVLVFWSQDGFYYFKFKDQETAKSFRITKEFILDYLKFEFDNNYYRWQKKRRVNESLNIDALVGTFTEKIEMDLKALE